MRFRKIPVEVEAVRFDGRNGAEVQWWAEAGQRGASAPARLFTTKAQAGTQAWNYVRSADWSSDIVAAVYDVLHETWVGVKRGQWVIRGTKGEMYPCDDDGTGTAPLNYERV